MRKLSDVKSKKIGAMLRLTAFIAALVMAFSFLMPFLRKSSALGAVGERSLAELSAFSTAVSFYSGGEITRLAQKPKDDDRSYLALAALLSQVNTQQGYEQLYLLYRDQNKTLRYLESGDEFPVGIYKPVKSMIDKIYTGKSVAAYATDLITRADGRKVAVSCVPIYGSGHTVLSVLVAESDPGNTGYHLLGPVNLYYVGGTATAVLLLCILLLYLGRKYKLAKSQNEAPSDAPKQADDSAVHEEPILPEDDFQLPLDPAALLPVTGEEIPASENDPAQPL